jgi:hypothetical protein
MVVCTATYPSAPLEVVLVDNVAGIEVVIGGFCPRVIDLALVDALARLRLAAKRERWTVHIQGLTRDVHLLGDVLALLGLDELFALDDEMPGGPQSPDDPGEIAMNQERTG